MSSDYRDYSVRASHAFDFETLVDKSEEVGLRLNLGLNPTEHTHESPGMVIWTGSSFIRTVPTLSCFHKGRPSAGAAEKVLVENNLNTLKPQLFELTIPHQQQLRFRSFHHKTYSESLDLKP